MARLTLKVNGKNQTVDVEPDMPLLYALRQRSATERSQVRLRVSLSAAPARSSWTATPSAPVLAPVSVAQNKTAHHSRGSRAAQKTCTRSSRLSSTSRRCSAVTASTA